jgi:arylsulfatase A-like enzyme/Flp pilus assembly protein TadD
MGMRRLALRWLAASGAALACAPGAGERPPNILLVSLDTTRADHVGAYGYAAAQTPALDRLAREGVLFEEAIAPAPITLPSHVSLLTGVAPTAHGVRDNGAFALGDAATLVSEALSRRGWRTGAFVGSYVLDASFGLDQGFEVYDGPALRGDARALGAARPADQVVDAAQAWLARQDDASPWFVWVHLYDPHKPYRPPQPFASRLANPYDGEIAFADSQLGRLFGAAEQRSRARGLLRVVTADHGEALGEHGEDTHGIFVYQATLRVPLLVAGPGVPGPPGRRVAAPVSLASVAATLLELAGADPAALPEAAPPLPLAVAAAAPAPEEPAIYFESYLPFYSMRWHALRGIALGRHKLVLGRSSELYDLRDDPAETSDLAGDRPEEVARLRGRLFAFEARHPALGWGARRSPDEQEALQLAALGYAQGVVEGNPLDPALPDPRERIEEQRRFEQADEAWGRSRRLERRARRAGSEPQRERDLAAAREERLRAQALLSPYQAGDNPLILDLVGKLALAQGESDRAAAALERAIAVAPGVAATHYNLGLAYRKLGRAEHARREFEAAYQLEPRQPRFSILVAEQLLDAGLRERARPWIERARALVPAGSRLDPSLAALEEKLAAPESEPTR